MFGPMDKSGSCWLPVFQFPPVSSQSPSFSQGVFLAGLIFFTCLALWGYGSLCTQNNVSESLLLHRVSSAQTVAREPIRLRY